MQCISSVNCVKCMLNDVTCNNTQYAMGIDELSIFTDMTLSSSLISLTRGEGLMPQQTLSIEGLLGDI